MSTSICAAAWRRCLATPILALAVVFAPAARGAESMELRLLRSVQLGVLHEVDSAELARFRGDGTRAGYLGFVLAVAAAAASGNSPAGAEWSATRVLDKTLGELTRHLSFQVPADFAAGFGSEDLVFTLVYALAIGGAVESATDILERHLASASGYKRAVVLQALHNLGTPRTTQVIQKTVETSGDQLAQNLLTERHYPFLDDLRARLESIPPRERRRERLVEIAAEDCGVRPATATYLLGFFAPAPSAEDDRRELALLRRLSTLDCHWTRFFAIRSLALRSPQSLEFWSSLYRRELDGWQKGQLVRIGWARFGASFTPIALSWLENEPVQYVQWELMHGLLSARRATVLRDHWDVWQPTTLQFRLEFPPHPAHQAEPQLEPILAWLDSGHLPRDPWVRNHLFHGLAQDVHGSDLRRYLRRFAQLPQRSELWWVLQALGDRAALPILRYWASLEVEPARRKAAHDVLEALDARREGTMLSTPRRCCRPTRECLLSQLPDMADEAATITTTAQAEAWLTGQVPTAIEPGVRFLDALARSAEVAIDGAQAQRWEHLYGCWRRTAP